MANFLDKILGSLRKSSGSVLGLDISSSSIKLVQLKKEKGRAVLETYGELALGPYAGVESGKATNLSVDKMSEALIALMKESKVSTKDCGASVPMSSSLVTVIDLPNVSRKQMEKMVPIEMRKYLPVPVSEVMMDWKIVPESMHSKRMHSNKDDENGKDDKGDRTRIFVVAIHREVLSRYQDIVRGAGLSTTFFEIEIFSTIRSVINDPISASLVVDFGAGTTKVYVISRGVVMDTHIINRGSQDITVALSKSLGVSMKRAELMKREKGLLPNEDNKNAEEVSSLVVENIFSEANRIMLNYQKKHNDLVEKVYLTGGGSILKGLDEVAAKQIDAEVIQAKPFEKVYYPAFLGDILSEAGPEFAVAIGVALRKLDEME